MTPRALAYAQYTSLAAAKTLSDTPATGAAIGTGSNTTPDSAIIQCETQAVRWTDDGSTPTAAIGMRLLPGQELFYDGRLTKLKFIEEAASAKLNVSYYDAK